MPVRSAAHINDEHIELYALGQLDPEQTSTVESHLSDCQSCREQFSQAIGSQLNLHQIGRTKSKGKYKRSEPRFSAGDQAFLQELSPLSFDRQTVKIVDLSRNGMGIVAPKSVFPGTIVQVRIKSAVELGEVRHCSASGDSGYRIGLRLHKLF